MEEAQCRRIFAVQGNHDSGAPFPPPIVDLHLAVQTRPFLRDGIRIRKHRWDLMNFSLPNRDLDRIWRLPFNMAASYRFRKLHPPPKGMDHFQLSTLLPRAPAIRPIRPLRPIPPRFIFLLSAFSFSRTVE